MKLRGACVFAFANAAAACSDPVMMSAPDVGATVDADAGASADAGPSTPLETLAALGIDTTLPADSIMPNGDPLPADYHPLRRRYTTLRPRAEVYWAGWNGNGVSEGMLDDGFADAPLAILPLSGDRAGTDSTHKAALSGDFDGDGIQEFVLVYYVDSLRELRVKLPNGTSSGSAGDDPIIAVTDLDRIDTFDDRFQYAVAASDVDGDGKDELVVGYRNLYVLDDADQGFKQLGDSIPYNSNRISVAAGDFDGVPGDKTGEFVVLYAEPSLAYVDIFDGMELVEHRTTTFELNTSDRYPFSLYEGIVASGNFDRDAADEIAFFGPRRGDGEWHVVLMDDANTDYAWFRSMQVWWGNGVPQSPLVSYAPNPNLVAVDIDGDQIDELFCDHFLLDHLEDLPPSSSEEVVDNVGAPPNVTIQRVPLYQDGLSFYRARAVAAGNVSPVGEVAPGGSTGRIGAEDLVGIDEGNGNLLIGLINDAGNFEWTHTPYAGGFAFSNVLAVANVDHDSPIVRYDGEHELLFTDPQVLVLLSAPPYYSADTGVVQNLSNTYTAFGTSHMNETSVAESLGLAIGWSIGYEANFLGVAKASWKLEFEAAFNNVSTNSRSITQAITYASGTDDAVVFTAIPFDVYYYTVVSAPPGSEQEVGRRLTVNMPRRAQTLLVSRPYYDLNNGDSPDTAALFKHNVGDPHSYPVRAQIDAVCSMDRCFQSYSDTVGEGDGYTEVVVTSERGMSTRNEFDFSVKFSTEVGAGGFTAGHSLKFNYGFAIDAKTTDSTIFTGRVGHIAGLMPTQLYSFAVAAYPVPFGASGNETMMIDYWVE